MGKEIYILKFKCGSPPEGTIRSAPCPSAGRGGGRTDDRLPR